MVGHGAVDCVEREDVVVVHGILIAIVVVGDGGGDVVGWVDVEFVVEDVGGGVRGVDVVDEGGFLGHFGL